MTYTELQIGKVLQLPELRYLYLDTTQLCRYQGRITEHVFANCDKNMETLCIKNSSRYALKCISFWARTGYFPADLRLILIIRMSYYDHMSLSHALSESIQQAPSTSVSYVSVYNQVCGKEFLQLQYQISPSGVTLLSCSDLQLTVASAKPGASEMISGKYLNATLQGNVKFSDVCCKVYELDLSGNKSLVPFDLQQTFAACPNLLHLNLHDCEGVLSDLDGLHAIATNCLKLRVLNLSGSRRVESVERLWRIFASMSNLKVLSLFLELLPQQGLIIPGPLPQLTAISVHGEFSETQNSDDILVFLARMTSLEVLKLDAWCEILRYQFHPLLQACSELTHLYLGLSCMKLILPTNTLQELFIADLGYEVGKVQIDALAQCRDLRVLMLRVRNFETTLNIRNIATTITSLTRFHVYLWEFEGGVMCDSEVQRRARAFAKSVVSTLKEGGRVVDLKICYLSSSYSCNSLQFPV